MDLEEDEKKGSFNPFFQQKEQADFPKKIQDILEGTMRAAIVEFEKLPLEQDIAILRNILYEGVKIAYLKKQADGKKMEEELDE